MRDKTVVLLSGGIDSATALGVEASKGFDCFAVTIDYGQSHNVEIGAAAAIARHYNAEHVTVTVGTEELLASPLTGVGEHECRTLEEIRGDTRVSPNYVPNRNMILLSIASGVAESMGSTRVVYSPNADDKHFPDCTVDFFEGINAVLSVVNGCQVFAPFLFCKKSEVVDLAIKLGVPLGLTSSCYQPDADLTHCGRCDACIVRRDAFETVGAPDPARYAVYL